MTTHQLGDPQYSYSQHLHFTYQQHASQVNVVKEASYSELPMLEGHKLWNTTSCIPTSSTNLPITYTMAKPTETQSTIIGVATSKSLQEVSKLDLY